MVEGTDYQEVLDRIHTDFPAFKVVQKKSSRLMKLCDLFLKIITLWRMRDFLVYYTTTIGYTVYVPSEWPNWDGRIRAVVLRHEAVHMRQRSRTNMLWYAIKYLFLWFPCFFAYFRMKYEMEAYEESMRADLEYFGGHLLRQSNYRRGMIAHFTSAQYFWTWPWGSRIEDWYDKTVERLLRS